MPAVEISGLSKVYKGGLRALDDIHLTLEKGEIFALLGPNGAGKTTLISILCGLVNPSAGQARVAGYDIVRDYRAARSRIGLVPQELTLNGFDTPWATLRFSRGLFNLPPNRAKLIEILEEFSLMDKRHQRIMALSGGMKRRVLIAKALAHEPEILFLDEPTAGVDVSLRTGMWRSVRELANRGVTVVLTTHYIEEAEAMADRVAVINKGQIVLIEEKKALMHKLGRKVVRVRLQSPLSALPAALHPFGVTLEEAGQVLVYPYETAAEQKGLTQLFTTLFSEGLRISDLDTQTSSLEDIFVSIVKQD